MTLYSFLILMSCLAVSCSSIDKVLNIPEDNIIEQSVEDIIEKETGIQVDFTPEPHENRV